jgi:outer membrane immunogenic protein
MLTLRKSWGHHPGVGFIILGVIMKRLANIIAVAGLIGTPAFAADLPVKAPPPPPPPTWTGWYAGANLGYSWGNARTEEIGLASIVSAPTLGGGITNPFEFLDTRTQRLTGVIGGIQGGYNYQIWNVWVLGWEADLQGSGERGTDSFFTPFFGSVCRSVVQIDAKPPTCSFPPEPVAPLVVLPLHVPLDGVALTTLESKIQWFGTVRMRGGVLLADSFMLYATGGAAYGGVSVSGVYNVAATVPSLGATAFGPSATGFSNSRFNVGWTLGGGVEGRFLGLLGPNWTWKAEYLYVDLGWLETNTPFVAASNNHFFTDLAGTVRTNTHFTDNIVRVGVNYHFGVPGAPY